MVIVFNRLEKSIPKKNTNAQLTPAAQIDIMHFGLTDVGGIWRPLYEDVCPRV